ncbi:MAG: hypothetical protein WC346_00205 [Methanogenium sp.]|jgi:hypothetical protein
MKKPGNRAVNLYVWSIEFGFSPQGIPERPLVRPSLIEYRKTFQQKILKAKTTFKEIWR